MRIAGAHHVAAVLEHQRVLRPPGGRDRRTFVDPDVDDFADRGGLHARERQIVARRKADHSADAAFGGAQSGAPRWVPERDAGAGWLAVRQEGGKIVVERERRRVVRISDAVRARVAGTEVAGRVVGRRLHARRRIDLSLPRPIGPLRRDDHPFLPQRIEPAMRMDDRHDVAGVNIATPSPAVQIQASGCRPVAAAY